MNAPPPLSPAPAFTRPVPNAANAFGGIWRAATAGFLAPSRLILIAAIIGVAGAITYATFVSSGRVTPVWRGLSMLYTTLIIPVITFVSGASSVRQEMKSTTVDYIFTRPIARFMFIAFRFLA